MREIEAYIVLAIEYFDFGEYECHISVDGLVLHTNVDNNKRLIGF
jgi:hypothetical protein